MAVEVLLRKLIYLRQLLRDLEFYRHASLSEVVAEHYKLERLFELLVVTASDILNHLLAEQGIVADSYRASFRLAGEQGMIPVELAGRLQDAAGMRNVLVHLYDEIDYTILHASIVPALADFAQFGQAMESRLDE